MKILVDATGIGNEPTGVWRFSYELIRELLRLDKEKENEYKIIVQESLKENHPLFELDNLRFLKMKISVLGPKRQIFYPLLWASKLKRAKYDIFHCLTPYLPILMPKKIRSIVTVHDLKYLKFPKFMGRLKSAWLRYEVGVACHKADVILVVSKSTKKDLIDIFRLDEEKVKVIYEGVRIRKGRGDTSKQFGRYFLFVGECRPHKNLKGVIKAFKILKEKERCDMKLIIAGKFCGNYRLYIDLVREFKLSSSVIFKGVVSDEVLWSLYGRAEALVFPSFYEGFGLPILEAMACGSPVITSNVSSMPEVAGEAALLVNPQNPEEIAEAMLKVVNSKQLRELLIRRGYERVKEFSWKKTAERVLEVYRSLI